MGEHLSILVESGLIVTLSDPGQALDLLKPSAALPFPLSIPGGKEAVGGGGPGATLFDKMGLPSHPSAPWVEGFGSILWLNAEYPGHFQVS